MREIFNQVVATRVTDGTELLVSFAFFHTLLVGTTLLNDRRDPDEFPCQLKLFEAIQRIILKPLLQTAIINPTPEVHGLLKE
jgi:hypothetical protein